MRAVVLIAALLAGLLLTSAPAGADGGAVFDFLEEYVVPGEIASASTVVWFGEKDQRRLERGPYQAYLLPDDKWIEPPRIPAEAVPVGTIEFAPPPAGRHKGLATISFVVPEVPTASYGISYCNDPCTIAAVGDLTGGWLRVADNAEAAQLLGDLERFEWKASSLEWKLGRARKQIDRLTEESESASRELAKLRAAQVADREQQRVGASDGATDPIPILAAGLGGLLLGLVIRRRRRAPALGSPVEEAERILERIH